MLLLQHPVRQHAWLQYEITPALGMLEYIQALKSILQLTGAQSSLGLA